MVKYTIAILTLILSINISYTQTYEMKGKKIMVEGEKWAKIKKDKKKESYLIIANGKTIASFSMKAITIGVIDEGGKEQEEEYVELRFLNTNLGNIELDLRKKDEVLELLIEENVLVNGKLSEKNAQKLKEKHHTDISKKYKYKPRTIIIED